MTAAVPLRKDPSGKEGGLCRKGADTSFKDVPLQDSVDRNQGHPTSRGWEEVLVTHVSGVTDMVPPGKAPARASPWPAISCVSPLGAEGMA